MACFKPIKGYRRPDGSLTFRKAETAGISQTVRCGQCIGCRTDDKKTWAFRCMAEAEYHEESSFVTFTYNDESLPHDRSLDHRHFQLFMKSLRNKFSDAKIKYFMCGEYGDRFDRPHYHALLFGVDFPDKSHWEGSGPNATYTSEILDKLWDRGFCLIGSVAFESAAYVAGYVVKKRTGNEREWYYCRTDEYGVVTHEVRPEYGCMSRGRKRGDGIGGQWFKEFGDDVYPADEIIINGHPCKPPRYFDKLLKRRSERDYDEVKRKREVRLSDPTVRYDNSDERLAQREKVLRARTELFTTRRYENGPEDIFDL